MSCSSFSQQLKIQKNKIGRIESSTKNRSVKLTRAEEEEEEEFKIYIYV